MLLGVLACDDEDGTQDGADAAADAGDAGDVGADAALDAAVDTDTGPTTLAFPEGFVFGAASAAHQIEGNNTNNQWYQFETLPQYEGATVDPSGLAANSYELWETDNQLVEDTNLGAYRFSIEWSRIEPQRGVFDDDAIAHYRAILEDLTERGITPFVTLHHFTDPIWVNDLTDLDCVDGPSDDNLCGWTHSETVEAFTAFAARMAQEYGDLVDEWSTFNEPNTYSHIGYLAQSFPPGHPDTAVAELPNDEIWLTQAAPVVRGMVEAHAEAYVAIHENDTEDADGDGENAIVGWTIATQYIVPIDVDNPDDVAAADRYRDLLNYIYPDSIALGRWDENFDGEAEEEHPEWVGRQDFIGVQYYTRTWAFDLPNSSAEVMTFVACLDFLAQLFPQCPEVDERDVSFINEVYPEGLYEVVSQFANRYPSVPLPITENGAAANNGQRKAQILVRHLEQVHRLVSDGFPVTAYYAWSLTDNFEWAAGFAPRFGLYHVDFDSFERTATRAQEVLSEVASSGQLSGVLREELGVGPLDLDSEDAE